MAHSFFNKITKKELLLVILLPFLILLFCVKGTIGNFNTLTEITNVNAGRYSGHAFEFSRTRSMYGTTLSIVNGQFNIDNYLLNFVKDDAGMIHTKIFSWAPPGTAIIGSIFFIFFHIFSLGQVGVYFSIVLVSLIIHYLIYSIIKKYIKNDFKTALLGSYIYTFASIALVYSTSFFQHQYTVLFILVMLYGIFETSTSKKIKPLWSITIPLIYSLSIFFDYPNILILFPLILSWFLISFEFSQKQRKQLFKHGAIYLSLGFSLIVWFQQTQFQSWKQMSNTLPHVNVYQNSQPEKILNIIETKNNISNIFKSEYIAHGLYTYILDHRRGLFFFSPILILGILSLKSLWHKRRRLCLVLLSLICTNIIVYASFGVPSGGRCFGPRYLLPTAMIFSILSALWITQTSRQKKILIFPLLLLSILNNLAGTLSTLTIPPTVDTTFYGIKNLEFILSNISGSFIYQTFLSSFPLIYYFLIIFCILTVVCYKIIFTKH